MPGPGNRAARPSRRSSSRRPPVVLGDDRAPLQAATLLQVQQSAGNRAASILVHRVAAGTVQRDHSDATSGGATTKTSVPVPKSGNWNAQDLVIGAIRRKPIEGLTSGNVRGDEKLGAEWGGEGKVDTITAEKAAGKAIVLLPEPLGAGIKTVDVMVYLHGFGIGYRQRIHSRQKTIKVKDRKKLVNEEGMEQGTVRDIEVDHMEAQLEAVNAAAAKANGRPMIAVMPQGTYTLGRDRPQFGETFLSEAYLNEVWGMIPALKRVARGRAVLAGHSGAGGTLAPMLGRAVDAKGELKAADEQEAGGLPKNLAEVVLFDALNSEGFFSGQRDQVERWLIAQIRKDLRELAKPTTDRDAYLKTQMVRFRGYFSQGSAYETRYKHLKENVAAALKAEIAKAEAGRRASRGRPAVAGWKLTAAQKQAMTDNYVNSIQGVATGHEKIMGQGKVQEALGALPVQPLRTHDAGTHDARTQDSPAPAPAKISGPQPSAAIREVLQRTPEVVQRDPTPDPDLAQWTADWNDSQFAAARRYFNETSRPSGTPETRYKILCPLYRNHGIARPLVYLKDSINGSTSFFGDTTPAHTGMQPMLAAAEKTLRDLKDDKGNPRYPTTPLKQRPWALTVRTTSSNKWSNHADGRAIDLDPGTNPHLDNAEHRAIINELTGMDIEARNPGAGLPLPPLFAPDSYDSVKLISDLFSANYNQAGLTKRSGELTADRASLVAERDAMKVTRADLVKRAKDATKERDAALRRKGATAADKTTARQQAKTALDDIAAQQAALKRQLAAKEKEVKAMGKRADRIAAELRKFTREQKAFDTTVAAVGAAQTAVVTGSTDLVTLAAAKAAAEQLLAQARKDKKPKAEIATLRKELAKQVAAVSKAKAALLKHQKSLKTSTKKRDDYTLRKYQREGILNLPKDVVEAMTKAGFRWGGDWEVHKDMMHFDMP